MDLSTATVFVLNLVGLLIFLGVVMTLYDKAIKFTVDFINDMLNAAALNRRLLDFLTYDKPVCLPILTVKNTGRACVRLSIYTAITSFILIFITNLIIYAFSYFVLWLLESQSTTVLYIILGYITVLSLFLIRVPKSMYAVTHTAFIIQDNILNEALEESDTYLDVVF